MVIFVKKSQIWVGGVVKSFGGFTNHCFYDIFDHHIRLRFSVNSG